MDSETYGGLNINYDRPLDKPVKILYIKTVHQRNLTMFSTPIHKRSIIDEIRDEIQLDEYYRKYDLNQKDDCDFYDDSQSECDFVFESFYE